MKRTILLPLLLAAATAQANDSTGFVETGGIQYLKNQHIEMQREDLYISQQQIRVSYTFKNNSAQDITEIVSSPLPKLPPPPDGVFPAPAGLIDSFRIWADGKAVKPQIHVRAFFETKGGKKLDMTAKLKQCGLSDIELMAPWTNRYDHEKVSAKIKACLAPQAAKLKKVDDDISDFWSATIVYSWKQTFKAGKTTNIKHQYTPLLGGSYLYPLLFEKGGEMDKAYCISDDLRRTLADPKRKMRFYTQLGYVLTTGANWAKPIGKFTLTIERAPGQLVSLCWDKSLRKTGPNVFRAEKSDFLPKKDLDVIFFTALEAVNE